jgi:hypothetical protein
VRCLVVVALVAACGGGSKDKDGKDEPSPIARMAEPPAPEAFCFNNRAKDNTLRGKALPPTSCATTLTKCNDTRTTTDGDCLPVPKAFSIKLMRQDGKVEVGWLYATEADCRLGYELAKKNHANPDEIVAGCWYDGKRLERTTKLTVTGVEPAVGDTSGGTAVRVLGSGFTVDGPRRVKVYFGTHEGAVVRFASDSELLVQSPAGKAGDTVDVTVVFEPGGEIKVPREFYENKKGFGFAEKKLGSAN